MCYHRRYAGTWRKSLLLQQIEGAGYKFYAEGHQESAESPKNPLKPIDLYNEFGIFSNH